MAPPIGAAILEDSWTGVGALTTWMQRHAFDLRLDSDENGWRATFLHRSHHLRPWVGQVLTWWETPWRAVHEAARRALNTQSQ